MFKKKPVELNVICENIRSLYNVGSVFRTSDALGVKKIWLCGITGTPEQRGLQKVSLGAENSVAWEHAGSAWRVVERLKRQGYKIVALELTKDSQNVKMAKFSGKVALIIGNEVDGVSATLLKRADAVVHIPMRGVKESLNVSVAFGIAAWEILK